MSQQHSSFARAESVAETERMVREEIFFRPARRAAIFCAIVCVSLLGYAKADSAAGTDAGPPASPRSGDLVSSAFDGRR